MLINFSFSNFCSFKNIKSLRMESAQIKDLSDSVIEKDGLRLLPVAVLYGANSSGKTNVIKSFGVFRHILINNVKLNSDEPIKYEPFMLDNISDKKPTLFEVQLLMDGALYRYGFEYTRKAIIGEWLYERRLSYGAKEHYLFRRERQNFSISSTYFAEGKSKESSTTKNRLFLSLVAQLNGQISQKIIQELKHYNVISGLEDYAYNHVTLKMLEKHLKGCDDAIIFMTQMERLLAKKYSEQMIKNQMEQTK